MNRLETLLSVLVTPMQRLENALYQLLIQRTVDLAVGVQLDVLGRIVGQPRGGLIDNVYRRIIRARIATNRSTGKREELLNIAALVISNVSAKLFEQDQANATWFLRVDAVATDGPTMTILTSLIKSAVAAGVRPTVQSAPTTPGGMFKFSGGVAGPGFDNTASLGTGGQLADYRDGN